MRSLILPLGCLILSSTCLAQTTNWVQVKPKNSPSGRWGGGTAYDLVRSRAVWFGGASNSVPRLNDTWEYDGTNWTQMKPKTVPPVRYLTSAVYHFARVRTVLFGGRGASSLLGDTWTWDGQDWTKMNPKNSPPARWQHGMVYDAGRQRTVLFGGTSSGRQNDTWEWDGVNWTQIKTKNAPSPRNGPIMVYDFARKRVVLFSGYAGFAEQDTWEYDGVNWTQVKTKTSPSARCHGHMAYDPVRKRTVMFSGWSTYLQETWEYDGQTWMLMKTATSPPGRYDFDPMMYYDQRRKRIVMFGGLARGNRVADTWEYVASLSLTGSPSTISIASGGTHGFSLDAGTANGGRLYWVFGSVTGTSPGVTLVSPAGSVNIPLNPDFWTDTTIGLANSALLTKTRGSLDGSGKGSAAFNVPKITNQSAIGVKFYHAFLVYDAKSNFYMASNPVELTLVK